MNIPTQQDPISMQLKQKLQDLQYGRSKDILNWTSKINSSITTF